MGIVSRFERRLQGAVGDAFARVFGGNVVPQEVETALQHEAADHVRQLEGGHLLAPNSYVITINSSDHEQLQADHDVTVHAFAKHLADYIHEQGWQTYGDIHVEFEASPTLHTGQFRTSGSVDPDAGHRPSGVDPDAGHRRSNPQPGAGPMTQNSGYDPSREPSDADDGGYAQRQEHPYPNGDRYPGVQEPRPADARNGYDAPQGRRGYPAGGYEREGYPPPPAGREPRQPQPYADHAGASHGYADERAGADGYAEADYADHRHPGRGYREHAPYDYDPAGYEPGYDQHGYDDADYGQGYREPGYGPDYGGQDYHRDARYAAPSYAPRAPQGRGYGPEAYAPETAAYGAPQPDYGGSYRSAQPPVTYTATLQLDDGSGRTYQLREGSNIIGRGQDAHFRLPDTGVSRRHIEVRWDGQVAMLSDLGSTNGTLVNGSPVQDWQLADGDVIRAGHSEILIRIL